MKKVFIFAFSILLALLLSGCIPIWYLITEWPQPSRQEPVYSFDPFVPEEDTSGPSEEPSPYDTSEHSEEPIPAPVFTADPAYADWDTWADTGKPLYSYSPVFTPGGMVYLDEDTHTLYAAARDYTQKVTLDTGCSEAFYYRSYVYYIKNDAIYRVQPQEKEPILVKQYGQAEKLTHIYLTGGMLFYIAVDADTGISAEKLFSTDLDGEKSTLVREGVSRILFGANGKLYYDHPVTVGLPASDSGMDDYTYDVMAYDLGNGQSSLLLGGATYFYGHHADKAEWHFFWFKDRLVYRPGVTGEQEESPVFQITFADKELTPYFGSPEDIRGDNRFHQWLVGGDDPGEVTASDMSTGEVYLIKKFDTVEYNDWVIISKTESFYRAFTLDGRLFVRTTAGHDFELVLRGTRLELVAVGDE